MLTTPSRPTRHQLGLIVAAYDNRKDEIDMFRQQVVGFFETSKQFHKQPLPLVHSVKSRLKSNSHLLDKVKRKWPQKKISAASLFSDVNDLAGVRILHLYSQQFSDIHALIMEHIRGGFWALAEKPTAYSWDPDTTDYFKSLGLRARTRGSYYTSVHYVVKPHRRTDLTCEIQVRTLFEEVWGEIDHALNYPEPSKNVACREQLRVLAKFASTGTRLVDAIYRISGA